MSENRLTKKDFTPDQDVRWCPGCGDYAILSAVQGFLPELGVPKENIAFISGIGCSGRFPYYVDTYGFHTIHGRALPIATGLKVTRPELSVWVVTGDGDALSIGGNHFLHCLRRNPDINILLFNNEIYGLTKGQYSPTSHQGQTTVSTPHGAVERSMEPIGLALQAGATFVARVLDIDIKGLKKVLKAASEHKGTSLIEIYQNCPIYNDGAFASFSERSVRAEKTIWLEDNKPMLFGESQQYALVQHDHGLSISKNTDQALTHDLSKTDITRAQQLARMNQPEFPVPFGIFYQKTQPTYESLLAKQTQTQADQKGKADLAVIMNSGQTWTLK